MREEQQCPFHRKADQTAVPAEQAGRASVDSEVDPVQQKVREVPDIDYGLNLLSPISTFSESPLTVLNWVRENYGTAARFVSPFGEQYFILSDPVAVDAVLSLTDKPRFDPFDKSHLLVEGAGWIIGDDNIIVTSNEESREQRKSISSFMGRSRFEQPQEVSDIVAAVRATATELAERIDARDGSACVVDLQHEMSVMALRVTLDSTFGIADVRREELDHFVNAARVVHSVFPIETLVPGDIPFDKATWFSARAAEITASKEAVLEFCFDIVERSRDESNLNRPTFVSRMLQMDGIKDGFVLNNVVTMIFAGHETSGNALGSSLANFALDPVRHQDVLHEVLHVPLEDRHGLKDMYANYPALKGMIEENLRMFPPVFLLMREATQDVEIKTQGGIIKIPAGAEIFLDVFGSQRNEQMWGVEKTGYPADEYHPERWSVANLAERGLGPRDMNLQCFGGGSRICAGLHSFFTTALAASDVYLGDFTFEPLFGPLEDSLRSDFSLQHEGGLPVKVTKRQQYH